MPNGSLGHRFGDEGIGRWNLDLGDVRPLLSAAGGGEAVLVHLPRFDEPSGAAAVLERGVPTRRVNGHLVTTVFDLMLAQYGVARAGLPGSWPSGYDDADEPCTPAWQERITGVPAAAAARVGREFAANAEESRGRSMIIMGAGTNHWFHSDTIYRAFLTLTNLTGCQGVNGGGWAHYVGQEKVRPITGYTQVANALDWSRPPRNMIQTAYWYLHTDQFRYDAFGADTLAAATAGGQLAGRTTADVIAQSARMGWMPSYPTFDRNPLDLADEARAAGRPVGEHVVAGAEGPAGSASPARTRTPPRTSPGSCRSGGPTCSGRPPRATSTSSSTCSARTPRCGPPRPPRACAPATSRGTTRRPRASSTCCSRWTSG